MRKIILILFLLGQGQLFAQELKNYEMAGLSNPLVPGYFADPSIKKIGDTYYLYATTDGNGWGAGPSQVWISKDSVNWSLKPMNWPNTHWYWAPDMTRGYDGKYYLYYSQPVEIFGASSDSPTGPWTPLLADGKSIIPNYMLPGVITLDAQTFTDDDGKIYMFWGTWGIYPDHGCAVGLLNDDMKTFSRVEKIPNTVAIDFFEAPFMFKKNGIYYLMYSSGRCEDETYRVQYVKSTVSPFGPYEYPENNPILVTNDDESVHGPGHHSILQENDDFYIVYHRHNNPHSGGGFHRQLAADKIEFEENGDIKKVIPTHEGIGFLNENTIPFQNQVSNKTITSSSDYSKDFRAEFAIDDNNGTLWRAKDNMNPAWIQIDFGTPQRIKTMMTQFEFATWFYEYLIEYSTDGKIWEIFADKRNNRSWGSPMVDYGDATMRYLKIHIFDTQIPGLPKGIWNIKAYEETVEGDFYISEPVAVEEKSQPLGLVVDISAEDLIPGQKTDKIKNNGKADGHFYPKSDVYVTQISGKVAFQFSGNNFLQSNFPVPLSLTGNSSFTVIAEVYGSELKRYNPVLSWSKDRQDLAMAEFGYGQDKNRGLITHGGWADEGLQQNPEPEKWHQLVFTFDGYMEKIWIDGQLVSENNKMLFMRRGDFFRIGTDPFLENFFNGYLASLKVYDYSFSVAEIQSIQKPENKISSYFTAGDLDYRKPNNWINRVGNENIAENLIVTDIHGKQSVVIENENWFNEQMKNFWTNKKDQYLVILATPLSRKSSLFKEKILSGKEDIKSWYTLTVFPDKTYKVNDVKYSRKLKKLNLNHTAINQWMVSSSPVENIEWNIPTDFNYLTSARLIASSSGDSSVTLILNGNLQPDQQYLFSNGSVNSGWTNENYHYFNQADFSKGFEVKVKDDYGNVSQPIIARNKPGQVHLLSPEIDSNTFWDESQSADPTNISITQDGIKLSSVNTSWDGSENKGPFLYKKVAGDFVFSAEISDLEGLKQKKRTSGEVGIMIRDPEAASETHIQNTILTGWDIGNMTTHTSQQNRIQKNNGLSWTYFRYLQIQKIGDRFFLRGSNDGKNWNELPGSPVTDPLLNNKTLEVGLFQASNSNTATYGVFRQIKLWLPENLD